MFLVTMKSEKCLHVPCKKRKQIVQVVRVDCRKKKKEKKTLSHEIEYGYFRSGIQVDSLLSEYLQRY